MLCYNHDCSLKRFFGICPKEQSYLSLYPLRATHVIRDILGTAVPKFSKFVLWNVFNIPKIVSILVCILESFWFAVLFCKPNFGQFVLGNGV